MTIVSAIIQLLGGLAMFLYGIEVMGDGLKNSSGAALKKVLEKVTGNVLMGVLTGTLVTAVIQSSTASKPGVKTGMMRIWATRSPGMTIWGLLPWLCSITIISPR